MQHETIDGTILSLIFQNEENGYTVLRLVTGDGELRLIRRRQAMDQLVENEL